MHRTCSSKDSFVFPTKVPRNVKSQSPHLVAVTCWSNFHSACSTMGDSYASLLERIETPQPSMQRFAVIAIFEKLRSAPPHLSVQSEAGREALFRCLHSPTGAVVDQAVRQLCLLVQEGHMSPPQGLQELQAVLDASPPHSVEVIAKGIGFLCRFVYTSRSPHISTVFASPELHPLVKAAVSRVEAHAELLQQAVLFINILDSDDFDRFIRPVLAFAVLNSSAHACFGRRLHSHLASLSCAHPPRGLSIFKLLVEFIAYYPHRTTQEIGIVIASAEELVSAFESILSKPAGKVEHARLCGVKLSESLIALCSDLSEHGLGSSSALVLLERLMLVQKDHDQFRRDNFNLMTAPLAHMLAAAEYEHEQLLLLNISIVFLQWKREKGLSSLQGIVMDSPLEVLFIFPVVHVMSSPSMAVKRTAASLLLVLEGILGKLWSALPSSSSISQGGLCYSHKVGVVVHQLLQQMWSQDKGLVTWSDHSSSAYPQWSGLLGSKNRSEAWLEHLKRSYSKKGERSRSILVSQHYGRLRRGGILLSCMLVTTLVMHPTLGRLAIKALVAIGRFEPMLGVSILLVVLFYLKVFYKCASKSQDMVLELLEVLPSLACNSVTVPLIIQILQPMLHRDAKLELRATAVRLLCRTWEVTDHAFAHLQVALQPKGFLASTLEMDLLISMAASVRDVCKKDADRGVDLVLSIQACIESENSTVRALGLQSLAHLCEADVVDFYTAWAVIGKHFPKVPPVPNMANGLCILLRWGAMDVEAYTEASKGVLKLIWEAAACKDLEHSDMWLKTRISAMEALTFYDVGYAQRYLPGFNGKLVELLLSEFNPEMQCILERLVVKTLIHEHGTRRRLQREGRVGISKVEKLLHVLPQILFHSEGKEKTAADIPGAALLCLIFSPPARMAPRKGSLRHLQKWQSKYGNALVEIAGSLLLSRNILVALLSLHSWTSFMQRWLRAKMMVFEAEDMPGMQEKIPIKAADGIFKDICNAAELAVPRVAENLALALGALCMVLPSSAHSVTFAASNFLLDWLGEDAHEYKQWPAAISLGLVSVCLHATDWEHKHKIIYGLLKVAGKGDRALVTGACGVGLGLACHDLLAGGSHQEVGTIKQKEAALLGQIVSSLSRLLSQLCPSVSNSLQKLDQFELVKTGDLDADYKLPDWAGKQHENLEENVWGIAGLVIGLGNCVVAIERAGNPTMVIEITNMLISWIPWVNSGQGKKVRESEPHAYGDISAISLAVGSCLALSTTVNVCRKMELMEEGIDSLLNGFRVFISGITYDKHHDYCYQNLLMAACIGGGNLLSCILNEAVQPFKFEDIKNLLEAIRKTYAHPNPPIVHLGGLIGMVNAMGAGAGLITLFSQQTVDLQLKSKQKETTYVRGPILSNPVCESFSLSLIQEILGSVWDSKDVQLRNSAGWALSFLRNAYWGRDQSLSQATNSVDRDSGTYISSVSQTFAEESTVWRLCSLLLDPVISETGSLPSKTIVSILKCLEKAPRLPALDWGGIMRRFMRYKDHTSKNKVVSVPNNKTCVQSCEVREECVHFSFVHAQRIPALLTFLDELCELSRFSLLEYTLQSSLLFHMLDMRRIFSESRMDKFFNDIMEFFSMQSVSKIQDKEAAQDDVNSGSLRTSFWKSLCKCLTEGSPHTDENYLCYIEKCMEIMFQLLPLLPLSFSEICNSGSRSTLDEEEWSEAVNCLTSAPKTWVLNFLQVKTKASVETEEASATMIKVILARARLVANMYIPPLELGKARSYLLSEKSNGIWRLLVEVSAALCHMTIDVKRQWLLDTIETGCITRYPSTALQFLGLLVGSWSPYASCLILDPTSVLQDLPLTLPSLFLDNNWISILDLVAHKLLSLTERIYNWLACLKKGEYTTIACSFETSEEQSSHLLLDVMQQTCISLRDHFSFDAQFKLISSRIL